MKNKNFMHQTPIILMTIWVLFILNSCSLHNQSQINNEMIFAKENLIAWCIVPFDAEKRNPQERAQMLNELGFTKMAWDWRMEHIDQLTDEIQALNKQNIELSAVWFWIDRDLEDGMLPHQEQILQTLEENKTRTTIWVCFSDNFFDDFDEEGKLEKAAKNITYLNERAKNIGCKVALYNHMHWFGEPLNQVNIIETIGSDNVGIVYNFHHGHHHIKNFSNHLQIMLPYLWTININGMNPDGPKILDLGKGKNEAEMLLSIKESGFNGTIGIIGHTEGEDIRDVLGRNLDGMQLILEKNEDFAALETYK